MALDFRIWASGRSHHRVDGRLLLATVVVSVLVAGGLYFWHDYSMGILSESFKSRAVDLAANEQYEDASFSLWRYLKIDPDDTDSRILLADYYDKAAVEARNYSTLSRAIQFYYQAIGVAPDAELPRLRHRLAELLFDVGRNVEAESIAGELEHSDFASSAKKIAGLAAFAQIQTGVAESRLAGLNTESSLAESQLNGDNNDSAKSLETVSVGERLKTALEANPGDPELTTRLATLYRNEKYYKFLSSDQDAATQGKQQREDYADNLINQMVDDQKSEIAYLARYRYRSVYGIPGRYDDLQSALKVAPESAKANYEIGLFKLQEYLESLGKEDVTTGDEDRKTLLTVAENLLGEAIRLEPEYVDAYLALGEVYVQQQRPDIAIETWQTGLQASRDSSPSLYLSLITQLVNLDRYDEAGVAITGCDSLLDRLVRSTRIDQEAGRRKVVELKQSLLMLQASMLMKQGKYLEAQSLLRQAVNMDLRHGETLVAALSQLATCYEASGMDEVAADCRGRASSEMPTNHELWFLAANAWMKAGRPNLAVEYFGKLAAAEPSAQNWLNLAVARQAIEILKPKESRDWTKFDLALSNAKKHKQPESLNTNFKIDLLEIVSRLRTDQEFSVAVAESLLDEAAESAPDDPMAIRQLMMFYEQIGNATKADRMRKRLVDTSGNSSERFLGEATLLITRGEMESAKTVLQEALERVPQGEKRKIEIALIELEISRGGNVGQAIDELKKLWQSNRNDLSLLRRLVTLAIFARTIDLKPEPWEKDLELIEEPGGSYSVYLQAFRDLMKAKKAANETEKNYWLETARIGQQELYKLRPLWSATHSLAGEIAEQSADQKKQAIDHYETAFRFGERRPLVLYKLVSLLLATKQLERANDLLPLLGDPASSPWLSAISQDIWINLGQLDRADALALRMVEKREIGDVNPLIGYGQILMAKNDTAKAEKVFRQALAEDDQNETVYLSLYNLYLRTDESAKAIQSMDAYLKLKGTDISDVDRIFIKGQSYELLQDPEAGIYYKEAMKLAPVNLEIHSRCALYFARIGDTDEAIKIRRRIRKFPNGDLPENQALLATLLAERGSESDWIELKELLTDSDAWADNKSSASRLYAMLLSLKKAARNKVRQKNLRDALALLEEIENEKEYVQTASSSLAFAMVYHQLRDLASDAEARESLTNNAVSHYRDAANAKDVNPGQLRIAAAFFLEESMLEEADRLIERLAAEEKNQESLATLTLRISLLKKRDQLGEINSRLEKYVESARIKLPPQRHAELYRLIGDLCLNTELYAIADSWYEQGNDGSNEMTRKMTLSLMRQGKSSLALQRCVDKYNAADGVADRTRKMYLVQLVSSLLAVKGVDENDFRVAEPMLVDAQQQFSNVASICDAIATVRLVQGRRDLAIQLFRQALVAKPDDPVLLNNLATTLSEDPADADEALDCIERAIEALGREAPALLDTKATILIHENPEEAERLLRDLENENADPRVTFHLAIALHRLGKTEESQKLLDIAIERGLLRTVLTGWESSQLEVLSTEEPASSDLPQQETAK